MKTELLILGGGPGGYVAAIRAARLGIETALVEKHKIGGICLNYGCIPTKALLSKTAILKEIKKGKRFGLTAENVSIDLKKLSTFKNQVVSGLVRGIEKLLNDSGVNIIHEEGRFIDDRRLELSSGEFIEYDNSIVATGSRNKVIKGLEVDNVQIIDSTGALDMQEIPNSLLVVGAGAIGLEMGVIYSRLGAKVTIVEMMPEILPGMDKELAAVLRNVLTKEGIKFKTGKIIESIEKNGSNIRALIQGEAEESTFEKVLVAVGRTPNTECLTDLKLELDDRGFVKVDKSLGSSTPQIKAIGDLTGPPLLAHRASHQGLYAVERIAGIASEEEFPVVPGAVFTEPEFASVGWTKEEAEQGGIAANESVFPLQAVSRARTMAVSEGGFKIVSSGDGGILGVHILAPNAGDMIAEASLAINRGLTVKELADSIHVHPTLSEGLLEAALLADDRPIHI